MPPKRGQKRKNPPKTTNGDDVNGDATLSPPDRATWPGWVEMESEPAFFNVMLQEMGVRGVKVQEVYGLDEEMLAILPQPVHALIFLFRYKDSDQSIQEKDAKCPEHVWFANQIPDFACATVALLNIVNNIKGLEMGKKLCDFRNFTKDMDPMQRGDAIDDFVYVKRIHNSFATDNDILNADMHMKQKAAKAKKRQALAKAKETKEARKAEKTPLKEKSANASATPSRTSARKSKASQKSAKSVPSSSTRSTPSRASSVTRKSKSLKLKVKEPSESPPLSDPPESDPDFDTPSKSKEPPVKANEGRRRSERKPKPRQDTFSASATAVAEAANDEGFHFIAYMPIDDHVWKLDGLDSFPHDMGPVEDAGGDWLSIAQPALQERMLMYEGADIEFNLMAIVHDPILTDRQELIRNVKKLQTIEKKLDEVVEDWRSLDGLETKKDVITASSVDFEISQADIDAAELPSETEDKLKKEEDLMQLIELRKQVVSAQPPLRAAIRDALEVQKGDEEKARHRRHDYGAFVKSWLGALVEQEALSDLLTADDDA